VLLETFLRGGWVMWPILAASVVSLALVLDRLVLLRRMRVGSRVLTTIFDELEAGRVDGVRTLCARSPLAQLKVVGAGVSAWGLPHEEIERRMEQEAQNQLDRFEGRLPLLGSLVAILPLLGFLGTILGLMESFSAWALVGEQVRIADLAGGISKAMTTTAAGLVTSIAYLVAYNWLAARAGHLARSLNAVASEVSGRYRLRQAWAVRAPPPLSAVRSVGGTQ